METLKRRENLGMNETLSTGDNLYQPDFGDWITVTHTATADSKNKVKWYADQTYRNKRIGLCDCFTNEDCTANNGKITTLLTNRSNDVGVYEWQVTFNVTYENQTSLAKKLVFYAGEGILYDRIIRDERLGNHSKAFKIFFPSVYRIVDEHYKQYNSHESLKIDFAFKVRFQNSEDILSKLLGDRGQSENVPDFNLLKPEKREKIASGNPQADDFIETVKLLNSEANIKVSELDKLVQETMSPMYGPTPEHEEKVTHCKKTLWQLVLEAGWCRREAKKLSQQVQNDAGEPFSDMCKDVLKITCKVAEALLLAKYDYIANSDANGKRRMEDFHSWFKTNVGSEIEKLLPQTSSSLNSSLAALSITREDESNAAIASNTRTNRRMEAIRLLSQAVNDLEKHGNDDGFEHFIRDLVQRLDKLI